MRGLRKSIFISFADSTWKNEIRVKIIRGDLKDPIVRVIDLYKVNNLKLYDLNIQSNDIIYIEPVYRLTSGILGELSPILSLISTFILISTLANP